MRADCCRDKVILLNRLTEVINFWQDEQKKHTVEEARAMFADCSFA
jgi:30S ribosomal protein 3